MHRRTLLRGLAATATGGLVARTLTACSDPAPAPRAPGGPASSREADPAPTRKTPMTPERLEYGKDPSQFGELHRPPGASRGVVVVVHGGFWLDAYDLSLGTPLAEDLAARGWTAWNLEYRRLGSGGGVPTTLDDVAAGIDRLADVEGLDLSTVVTLGHSAGGHLGTWAAARGRSARWSPAQVPVTQVISQAGVLDLRLGSEQGLGGGAVDAFVGHPPTEADADVDPAQEVPLQVPVWCVHGEQDSNVPLSQSEAYVDQARAAGADVRLEVVPGDHFVHLDTTSEAWSRTVRILEEIAPPL